MSIREPVASTTVEPGGELAVRGIPSDEVDRIRRGGADANGQPALTRIAEGVANPCRHCLGLIAAGAEKLVLAYRPFDALHPYAETGPIFLHETSCQRYDSETLPTWFGFLDPAIIRGYGDDDDQTIAYVYIRSTYNCFQCRVERA